MDAKTAEVLFSQLTELASENLNDQLPEKSRELKDQGIGLRGGSWTWVG